MYAFLIFRVFHSTFVRFIKKNYFERKWNYWQKERSVNPLAFYPHCSTLSILFYSIQFDADVGRLASPSSLVFFAIHMKHGKKCKDLCCTVFQQQQKKPCPSIQCWARVRRNIKAFFIDASQTVAAASFRELMTAIVKRKISHILPHHWFWPLSLLLCAAIVHVTMAYILFFI